MLQLALPERAPDWVEALLQADQDQDSDRETDMRAGDAVSIILNNKFKSRKADPDFVRVPGVVVSDPMPSSYTSRSTGAVIPSSTVEVISLRDTRGQNPQGGRVWLQQSTEPSSLLLRRFGEPVVGLDVTEAGERMTAEALYGRLEASLIEFRQRSQAARHRAAEAPAEIS